jgi:phage anti-repressor protein
MARKVRNFNDGSLHTANGEFFFKDVDGESQRYPTRKEATEAYYIKQAYDYMGCGIRDNTREEKIYFGRKLDRGEMEGGL